MLLDHAMLTRTILVAAIAFTLPACKDSNAAPETSAPRNKLVALDDGTTLVAPRGTLARDVSAWLGDRDAPSKKFALGSDAFVGGTSRLSPQGLGRAASLGTLLRASPDAVLTLDVAKDAPGSLRQSRAKRFASFLEGRGILSSQVRFEAATGREPGSEDDEVVFTLRRMELVSPV